MNRYKFEFPVQLWRKCYYLIYQN